MEPDILNKIIHVEQEIQETLEREKRKSSERIRTVQQEVEAERSREERALQESLAGMMIDGRESAEGEASRMLRDADLFAQKVETIDETRLQEIVLRHIQKIIEPDS